MKKILIAEDELVTRTILAEQVESFGYRVVACDDGRKALDVLLQDTEIDLLITDIMMPDMDGKELIARLRRMDVFASLPIIIMSGVVGVKDISGLLESGASRFLAKPIDAKDLEETISRALAVPHIHKD